MPAHIAFVDAIPITPTQKLQRGAIKALAAAAVGAPGTIDLRAFKATLRQREKAHERRAYDGVVIAAPVTIPYVRYSTRDAHWFLGRALAALVKRAGVRKSQLDGLCVSSFTLFPDTAVGLTQHLGLSPRWLDHIPMGGASGVVALRRAARAVQSGDAEIVAPASRATPTTSIRSGKISRTSAASRATRSIRSAPAGRT